jgi:hypothetical protein
MDDHSRELEAVDALALGYILRKVLIGSHATMNAHSPSLKSGFCAEGCHLSPIRCGKDSSLF